MPAKKMGGKVYRKKISVLILLMECLQTLTGCSVSNVVTRGEYVDERSIKPGITRKELLARFGAPIDSKQDENGLRIDIFRVPQGEKTVGKVLKGGGLLILAIGTIGLSESIFYPVTDDKDYVTFEVLYKNDRVETVKFISK